MPPMLAARFVLALPSHFSILKPPLIARYARLPLCLAAKSQNIARFCGERPPVFDGFVVELWCKVGTADR